MRDLLRPYHSDHHGSTMMRISIALATSVLATAAHAQVAGIPASDTLGAEDLAGNPSFIGGVANGGSTAHGIW